MSHRRAARLAHLCVRPQLPGAPGRSGGCHPDLERGYGILQLRSVGVKSHLEPVARRLLTLQVAWTPAWWLCLVAALVTDVPLLPCLSGCAASRDHRVWRQVHTPAAALLRVRCPKALGSRMEARGLLGFIRVLPQRPCSSGDHRGSQFDGHGACPKVVPVLGQEGPAWLHSQRAYRAYSAQ